MRAFLLWRGHVSRDSFSVVMCLGCLGVVLAHACNGTTYQGVDWDLAVCRFEVLSAQLPQNSLDMALLAGRAREVLHKPFLLGLLA